MKKREKIEISLIENMIFQTNESVKSINEYMFPIIEIERDNRVRTPFNTKINCIPYSLP